MTSRAASQSQFRMIWRQFRQKSAAVRGLWLIAFLIGIAVYAPFLANDKPLYFRGVNQHLFRESLRPAAVELGKLIEVVNRGSTAQTQDSAAAAASTPAESSSTVPAANPVAGLQRAVKTAGALLTPADRDRLQAWLTDVESSNGGRDLAGLKSAQQVLQAQFLRGSVALQPSTSFPILFSLSWLEIWFMVLYPLFIIGAILATRERIGRGGWLLILLVPTLVAVGWWWLVPARLDRTPYKSFDRAGEAGADVAASAESPATASPQRSKSNGRFDTVVWPPVPYGLDEAYLNQKYTSPPWHEPVERLWTQTVGRLWGAAPSKPTESTETQPALATKADPSERPAADGASAASSTPGRVAATHWLGTDGTGRDLLCRMIWGARVSLSVGVVSVSILVVIGIIVGASAGYFRGWVDIVLSRIVEIVICFPTLFLILTIIAFVGPGLFNIMIVIGLTAWTGIARLVRAEFLRLVEQEFVLACRALGYSNTRIIFLHILPNAIAPVLVSATFGIAGAILTESSLSFLGFGILEPTPSWGGILNSGRDVIDRAPWLTIYPGLAIFVTILSYNIVGEALRDASDPRLRGSRS